MASPTDYHYGKFPPPELEWQRLIPLLGPASAALARYDALLHAIPNAAVLLSPLTTQEAVLSSRIEGTYATMGEVLQYEADGAEGDLSDEKREDIHEVINYRVAMRQAVDLMDSLPLCNRLIKSLHRTLLSGVRGENKLPGEFRTTQNYIGVKRGKFEDPRFVPIAPDQLEEGMHQWEQYVHRQEPDTLVQLAVLHAEFESLHPFLDGNGRIGRILIPLFLFDRKLLREPMFYLSEYLEENRDEYVDRLFAVSQDDDWTGWCEFFLVAITEQAGENESRARMILEVYEHRKDWIVERTNSQYAIRALDFVFSVPIFNASHFIEQSNIPPPTARRILRVLNQEGLLTTIRESSGRRPAVYAFTELLSIAEGRWPH